MAMIDRVQADHFIYDNIDFLEEETGQQINILEGLDYETEPDTEYDSEEDLDIDQILWEAEFELGYQADGESLEERRENLVRFIHENDLTGNRYAILEDEEGSDVLPSERNDS